MVGSGNLDIEPANGNARLLHLLYHEVYPDPRAYAYAIDAAGFAEHLKLFAAMRDAGSPLQPVITFDDGHSSVYEQALPLLRQNGLTAWFFLTAGWLGKRKDYLNWDEVRKLHQAGHRIGAHGWNHALLTHCNAAELQRELVDTRQSLEDQLGVCITALSFPGGRYNRRVLEACREAGYTEMFTSEPRSATVGQQGLIGRLNLRGDTTAAWLEDLFAADGKLLQSLKRQDRLKTAAKRLLGDRLYASLWRLGNRAEAEA